MEDDRRRSALAWFAGVATVAVALMPLPLGFAPIGDDADRLYKPLKIELARDLRRARPLVERSLRLGLPFDRRKSYRGVLSAEPAVLPPLRRADRLSLVALSSWTFACNNDVLVCSIFENNAVGIGVRRSRLRALRLLEAHMSFTNRMFMCWHICRSFSCSPNAISPAAVSRRSPAWRSRSACSCHSANFNYKC